MAETIASLGGVPLGRAGTGTAVILGEKDYSYLKPEKVKPEKYTPLIGDDEIGRWLKEAGTVWKPDQARGREKVNELITKTKQMELLNKTGEKDAARKLYDEIQQDTLGFANWVKNSKDNEASGTKFETDWRNNSLLYDQGDWDEYLKWKALDPNERSRNVPSQRADDLNYVPYAIKNITAQIKPDKDTIVQDRGGFRDTKTNTYYTEDEVKRAALASAYMTSGKYLNMWRQKMMNKAVMDDPMTDVNEAELATQIISNIGPGGVSPELYEFIAGQNYLLFSGNMERVERKKAPIAEKKPASGGAGGAKEAFTVTTGQSQFKPGTKEPLFTDIYSSKKAGTMPVKKWQVPTALLIEANKKYNLGLVDLEGIDPKTTPYVSIDGTFLKASKNQQTGEMTVTFDPIQFEDQTLVKGTVKGGITLQLGPENKANVMSVLNDKDPEELFMLEEKKKMVPTEKKRKAGAPPGAAEPKPISGVGLPDFSKMTPEQVKAYWINKGRITGTKK